MINTLFYAKIFINKEETMGFSAYAVSKVKLLHKKDECDGNSCVDVNSHKICSLREGFIERLDGYEEGCYAPEEGSEGFYISLVCYSSHFDFCNVLSHIFYEVGAFEVANSPEGFEGEPFFELIFKADHDGAIGPKTSAKLARDFKDNREIFVKKLREAINRVGYYGSLEEALRDCDDWHKGFVLASANGFVIF
ncbi:hypothetical protein ACFL29_00545 [Patescibacteria group bacterium]